MSNSHFDVAGFYAALDGVRQSRGITWKKVASETGVAASTLTRIGQGKRPDVDGLAALASWSNLDVSHFYRSDLNPTATQRESLGEITALLRADKNLSSEGAVALETMLKSAYEQIRKK
ncbi:MAG: helix-turn-helix domain-containing protein [Pseudomonadota bacterium]